ncbi:MAG: hypothetical protein KDA32_11585 [Phycisphaerales bacterium]|nr:hypothetical protein [Phycisphaerales bacterium]
MFGRIFGLVPYIVGGIFLSLIVTTAVRAIVRRVAGTRKPRRDPTACAACGYPLAGLPTPRCPECGALRGFRVSVEKLGISEEELRAGEDKREEADESAPAP